MIYKNGGSDSTEYKGKSTGSLETMTVKQQKAFVIFKAFQRDKVWSLEIKGTGKKETAAGAFACCPALAVMRMLSLIGLFTATTILTIVLIVARQSFSNLGSNKTVTMDALTSNDKPSFKQTSNNNNNNHLLDDETYRQMLSHERLMRPAASWKPVDEKRVVQEWQGDGGLGKAGLNQSDQGNPPSLGRSSHSLPRSVLKVSDSLASESKKSFEMEPTLVTGRGVLSGRALTSTPTLKYRQSEVINIDKIKGLEASPSDIRELKTVDDLEAAESTINDQSLSGTNPLRVQSECTTITNKYDIKIAKMLKQNNLSRPIIKSDGRFDNPFSTWTQNSMIDAFKFTVLESDESSVPKTQKELNEQLPLVKPDFATDSFDEFRVTWIGHSTMVIQVNGLNIITDPIFSDRASPTQFFGPKRIVEPACRIKDLPRLDIAIISHNHYDHLDVDSVREINDRFGTECRWIVPLGLGAFMKSMGVGNYQELDWWQKDCFSVESEVSDKVADKLGETANNTSTALLGSITNDTLALVYVSDKPAAEELSIYFTPAQHWSRRGVTDVNRSLWGSYTIVNRKGATFLFAGDTGYCSAFKEIGEVFGPFMGAAIPIGAYKPRWFLKTSHIDPDEAVKIHRDLKSKKSISMHHSTFILSTEHYLEPSMRLKTLMENLKLNSSVQEPFISLKHGETTLFPDKARD